MRRFFLTGRLLALAVFTLPAKAQFFGGPLANPYARGLYGPYGGYTPYGIYGQGGIYGGYGPGYGGYGFGGPGVGMPFIGNPAVFGPGRAGLPQQGGAAGQNAPLNPGSTGQTGHPVRFQAYRGYFMNRNASLMGGGTTGLGGLTPGLNQAAAHPGLARFGGTAAGKRPARGKDNLTGP